VCEEQIQKLEHHVGVIEKKVNNLIVSSAVGDKDLKDMAKKIDDMHLVIMGDEEMGFEGLVKPVKKNTKFRVWATIASTVLLGIWGIVRGFSGIISDWLHK